MGRLPAGMQPTPAKERMKIYRQNLESSGGKRITFDLPAEAAEALEAIQAREGNCTARDAVTMALIKESKRKKAKAPAPA